MIEIIGLLPAKQERDSFWLCPTLLDTQDNINGQNFDMLFESNLIKMQDLKERAISFMKEEGINTIDFSNFQLMTNSYI
mgnify:CR=1 FL=1